MDNGSTSPYRLRLVSEDGEGQIQLGDGNPSASEQGVEVWWKQTELSHESGELRLVSGGGHAS